MSANILVIDDDPAIRKAFSLIFEDSTYQLDLAESGYEGIEKIQDNNYRLIFLDLKMPGISGVETLKRIRTTHPDLLVYIVTAFHPEYFEELKPLSKIGSGFELISKPVTGDRILEVANVALS